MKNRNKETLQLAEEILRNIELNELPLRNIALKCSRLARITNNTSAISLFQYELASYPKDADGKIQYEAFQLARYVNRVTNDNGNESMFIQTISELESELETAKEQMRVATDPNISITSSNPHQYLYPPSGNTTERSLLRVRIADISKKIDQLKTGYYQYVLGVFYELRYTTLTESIFEKRKLIIDKKLSKDLPEALQKFVSSYENLQSNNQEDWANAVHSCRRILKDVADYLYPSSDKEIEISKKQTIKLNDENYIARLKEYIKNKHTSKTFTEIVGSHLDFIGDRLDSLYKSSNKGTHAKITKEEAERYTIYVYLLLGDILSL